MVKFKKRYAKVRTYGRNAFLDSIMKKKSFNLQMRILSYFIDKKQVKQSDLLEEIFGKSYFGMTPEKLMLERLFLSTIFYQIRQQYGIYIRTIFAKERYCKLMTEKEDFEWLLNRIEHRIENLEIERENVKNILNDLKSYIEKVNKILDTIADKLKK